MVRQRRKRGSTRIRKSAEVKLAPPSIPSYLLQKPAPSSSLPSPVQTRQQDLPFERLPWDCFERLCRSYEFNEITLLYVALNEPLDSSLITLLQPAVPLSDLSQWQDGQDFSTICMTLAQYAIAVGHSKVQKAVTEKLTDAWMKTAQQPVNYVSFLNAMLVIITNSDKTNRLAEFYKWWREIVEKIEKQIPQEVYDTTISHTWRLPLSHQIGIG